MNPSVKTENSIAGPEAIRENKLAIVERLADDLAHEIKNPLHSMVINLEVLRRRLIRLEVESSADLLRYAGVIGTELERVNRRVDLLLRMVRPQRDTDETASLVEVLEELRELVQLECERHEVALRMEVPEAVIRGQLPRSFTRQMVLSLILKSLDSAPVGGTLNVHVEVEQSTTRVLVFSEGPQGEPVKVDSSDDGESYLAVALALAQKLGGQLDLHSGLHAPAAAVGSVEGYLLTLPH